MARRFEPWVDPHTGEVVNTQPGLIWWETIDDRYQAEVQEGILPNVANYLIFDTDNGDEILMNEIIVIGAAETPDEARDIWVARAEEFLATLPEEG